MKIELTKDNLGKYGASNEHLFEAFFRDSRVNFFVTDSFFRPKHHEDTIQLAVNRRLLKEADIPMLSAITSAVFDLLMAETEEENEDEN